MSRSRPQQARFRRRLLGLGLAPLLVAAGAAAWLVVGHAPAKRRASAPPPAATTPRLARPRPRPRPRLEAPARLVERRSGSLPAPLQDAAVAARGSRILLLGGLTAQDTSEDTILSASRATARPVGRLPQALHDTAAVWFGRWAYVFGGGNTTEHDAIVRVDPATGASTSVGRLPEPSSDQAAAAIGGTAYVVGGYTGTRWLDTIVAWRPHGGPRVVAHLPFGLRYAAVADAAGRLVIAGGSLADGRASSAILEYVPGRPGVRRIGRLPVPTTHAAAAAIGAVDYVIGGRGAVVGTPVSRVVAVDSRTGRVRLGGRLSAPRSDLAAVALGSRILLAGGSGPGGTTSALGELVPVSPHPIRATADARTATTARGVYAFDGAGRLARAAQSALPRIYVPNSGSDTVDVIDPSTFRVVGHFAVGALPQHVTPSWDLRTLYVLNDEGNSVTPIDPRTARPGRPITVTDPYNMYFTPDGRYAIVVAERLHRLDFRDAHTFRMHRSVPVPCSGVDHMDFSADGRYLVASCEFSGQLVKVDVARERVLGTVTLPDGSGGMPQDVKLSPDGRVFYVADMMAGGIWKVDGDRLKVTGFLHTGRGAHGLYPSRDARFLYVTNRGEGSISVVGFRTGRVVRTWRIPGGGSPDMGGVSADGKVLWVSGRYNAEVYAISTVTGKLVARIPVGSGPHGLCVWPQPGRYSLGHTGILR